MNRSVEIHIEELVLHGYAPQDRYRIAAAVEAELVRLFTEKGLPSLTGVASYPLLNGHQFQLSNVQTDQVTGNQIAGAVYSAFTNLNNK